ncbi:MAG: arylesterase [Thermoanaerobaculia bacterium]
MVLCSLAVGCRSETHQVAPRPDDAAPLVGVPTTTAPPLEEMPLVVYLGDSLAAGWGLPEDEAYPAQLDRMLAERGLPVRTVNAGVSGDTTAGGLARLEWLLRLEPDVLVLELGANDALRGLDPEVTERNLRQIIGVVRRRGPDVLLAGMKVPPNYGADYARRFEGIFPRLARELELAFLPFLLEEVAGRPELNLADGIHPNAQGQRRVAENLLPVLEGLLRRRGRSAR